MFFERNAVPSCVGNIEFPQIKQQIVADLLFPEMFDKMFKFYILIPSINNHHNLEGVIFKHQFIRRCQILIFRC